MDQSKIFELYTTLRLKVEKGLKDKATRSSLIITYQNNGLSVTDISDENIQVIALIFLMIKAMDRDHYAEKPNDFKAFELYDAVTAKCDAIAKVKASKEDFDIYQNITL